MLHSSMVHLRLVISLLACLLPALGTGGCAFQQHREDFARTYALAGPQQALSMLNDPKVRELYGEQDRLLFLLDYGTLKLIAGDPAAALVKLEQAEEIIDYGGPERRTAGDAIAEWLINDTAAAYSGEPYESIYLNVLKLCAQLTRQDEQGLQGVISGGASVEARRANAKADFLRRRFDSSQSQLARRAQADGSDLDAALSSGVPGLPKGVSVTSAGNFIESPLGTYLSAVTFMKSGEADLQQVAARRLTDSIKAQPELIGPVDPAAFSSLGELRPSDANVLLVAFSGFAPTKVPQRIGPIPVYSWPVYFEIPVLRTRPSRVASVRATLTPRESSESNPPQIVQLNLVENLASVAEENHRRQLPQIYARALIRSSLKSGASFAATQAIRNNTGRGSGRDAATIAAVVGGLALLTATERADTRTWVTLPGQAHVALARLPAGTFDARVEYLDSNGQIVRTRTVNDLSAAEAQSALATAITFCTD